CDRYGAGRPEPCARRDFRRQKQRDAAFDTELMQKCTRQRQIAVPEGRLTPPLTKERAVIRGRHLDGVGAVEVDKDIEVLVDGRRYDQSAMLLVVRRQICSATCETDAHRRPNDQHAFLVNRSEPSRGEMNRPDAKSACASA